MVYAHGVLHEDVAVMGINHIERCFDAFVVSEVEKEIQYHKGKIKYSAERLEELEQRLKNNKLEGVCHEEGKE
jgi:hypothetical protein